MSFKLPALTKEPETITPKPALTAPLRRPLEPIGRAFLHHATRTLRNHTWSEFERLEAAKNVTKPDESNVDPDELLFDSELADKSLLTHDARDWKTADLYAAMGLSKLRYRATNEQIIKAHRRQVVKHHPDKQGGVGGDNFFKIIQKAFETLTDRTKRRQYDSCDFAADVPLPPKKDVGSYDFFEAWAPVFESEARFSKKKPVSKLGNMDSSKKEVEDFYSFWHRFDSWRTFEFLDEEAPDDSSNRDHKRYIERKNKAARDKKKTADNARLVKLVERAMSEDPRIKKFKEEEKKEKERKKWEREAGARAEAEAKAKAEAEAKAKAEAEAQKQAAAKAEKKKSKEAIKAAKKKNKRAIRGCGKDHDYFGESDKAAAIDEQLGLIVDCLEDEQLSSVAEAVKNATSADECKAILVSTAKGIVESGKLTASILSFFQ